jgi:hypothetical protein
MDSFSEFKNEPDDDPLNCDHINRSLLDNGNFDQFEERLIEDGINRVDRKKKEIIFYINHLNEIADKDN